MITLKVNSIKILMKNKRSLDWKKKVRLTINICV